MNRIFLKLAAVFIGILLLFSLVLSLIFLYFYTQQTVRTATQKLSDNVDSVAAGLAEFQEEGNVSDTIDKTESNIASGRVNGSSQGQRHHNSGTGQYNGNGNGGYNAYIRYLGELTMTDVWVFDADGEPVVIHSCNNDSDDTSDGATELTSLETDLIETLLSGQSVDYTHTKQGTPEVYAGRPVTASDGSLTGAVLMHAPVDGIQDAVRRGGTVLFAGLGAALVLALILSITLAYWITRPLRRMEQTATVMANGDYTARTGICKKDEIGSLAGSIDRLGKALSQAEKAQAAMNQMKQDFVANVSHELRTPVAVMKGSAEQLLDGSVSDPKNVQEYYEAIYQESCHMEALVGDLLDLSRLQSDAFEIKKAPIDPAAIVSDVARFIRPAAQKKNVTVRTLANAEPLAILGDYTRVRQLVLILVDNAVKFADSGSIVTLRLEKADDTVVLSVTDQGETIPPDRLSHIFDRFEKSGSANNSGGTGLGLTIAKQIVRRHNAVIDVTSEAGETCFTVVFPQLNT